MDPRFRPYVIQSDFYGLYHIGHVTLDWDVITILVDIWRPETHISFIGWGHDDHITRCCYHLGPWIHGPPIIGTCDFNVSLLCQELLGVIRLPAKLRGSVVSTRWLSQ